RQQRSAAADLHGLGAAEVGLLRQPFSWNGWRLRAGDAVGGAGGETDADIVSGYDDSAVLGKVGIAADVVAVEMRVDQVFDGQGRDRRDRRLDLGGERRELAVDHDDAVGADGDGDGAALAFQPVGFVAEIGGLDLDLVPVDRRLLRARSPGG